MTIKFSEILKKIRSHAGTVAASFVAFALFNSLNTISSFVTTYNYVTAPHKDEYEGWILVRITGFGYTLYPESNLIIDFSNPSASTNRYLSRSSRIITMIYTDAVKKIEKDINNGNVKDYDTSVLTNTDAKVSLRGERNNNEYDKNNSQTFQSQLALSKELKKPVCLYVKGVRDGRRSTFLNIIKMQPAMAALQNKKGLTESSPVKLINSTCGLSIEAKDLLQKAN
jgi:hypothetical protein